MLAHQFRTQGTQHVSNYVVLLAYTLSMFFFSPPAILRASPAKDIPDQHISVAIESRFIVDKSIPADFIDVKTNNGIVSLTGRVTNLLAKERASKIVESIRGVKALINTIRVQPPNSLNDADIERNVLSALAADPATDSYELTVTVQNGIVTLGGLVESWGEKQLSEEVAKSVKGVKDVANHINVNPSTIRPDSEIEAEIVRLLQSDVWIHERLIGVLVDQGKVTLVGTVGSLAEKYIAFTNAWVLGVKSVNVERLEVKWWAEDRMLRTPNDVVASNTQQEKILHTALSYHPRIKEAEISVQVRHGTATLTGLVSNLATKQAAEDTARNVIGIWRVRNLIKVRPTNPVTDHDLKQRIINALNKNPLVDRYDIKVISRNGIVSIEGYIDSPAAISQAVTTVAKVKGVAKVINNLQYDHADIPDSDEEIWEKIRRSFWWDLRLYDQDITVAVSNGTVTLQGTVPSIIEWRRATQISRESGAKRVQNKLKVKRGPDFLTG